VAGVRVVGVLAAGGEAVFRHLLAHGEDPTLVPLRFGHRLVRTVDARRTPGGIELRILVEPSGGLAPAAARPPGRDADLEVAADEPVRVLQRVAAYAVVISGRGLLATQYSHRTGAGGRWGLPGGGVDSGEEPAAAVGREVTEETSQEVGVDGLIAVQSGHWVGRSPRGDVEDFHAVRLVYAAHCDDPGNPRVLDVDGTTAAARWVPLSHWESLDWTTGWREVLTGLPAVSGCP
jgi:ADP-ribose pyrophosphatase YjhB (NUDIX family)